MLLTEIQRFCMYDGPGIRTTVFLKGCPLRCKWCHNPETQSVQQQILFYRQKCILCGACATVCPQGSHLLKNGEHVFNRGRCIGCQSCVRNCCSGALEPALKRMTIQQILSVVESDRAFYGKEGGITLSGGEPMMQPHETIELLEECRKRKIGTAIETCGYFDTAYLPRLVPVVDWFLWDYKDGNDNRHREYTGVSNCKITKNLFQADALGARTILRCIMVRGINMRKDHYDKIAYLWHRLRHCRYVQLLPYHTYGGSKMPALGKEDNGNSLWIPTEKGLDEARKYLREKGVRVK